MNQKSVEAALSGADQSGDRAAADSSAAAKAAPDFNADIEATKAAAAKPAKPPFRTSKTKAGVVRSVHVYCPDLWEGPQPGIVSGAPVNGPVRDGDGSVIEEDGQLITVNVLVDAARNPNALKAWRGRPEGNTMVGVPIYDALTDDQRIHAAKREPIAEDSTTARFLCWAEWPPRN